MIRLAAPALLLPLAVAIIAGCGSDQIDEGVRVAGVDVSGLPADVAGTKLRRELGDAVRRPVTVRHRSQRFVLRADKLPARLDVDASVEAAGNASGGDVPARVTYPRAALEAFVRRVAGRAESDAKDADIDVRDGKIERTRARNGVEVRRRELSAALARAIVDPSGSRELALPVKVVQRPDRTLVDLANRYPTVIAIDRDAKVLRLYKRLRLDRRYKIAVGKAGFDSAAGRYEIEEKIVDPPWHAPDKAWAGDLAGRTIPAGDPRNPLEARFMGYHDGEGIHGTKDIRSLGESASHGCIRMSPKAVKQLYDEVKVGTPVFMQ